MPHNNARSRQIKEKMTEKMSEDDKCDLAEMVCSMLSERFDNLDEKVERIHSSLESFATKVEVEKVKCNVRVGRYEQDRLEQYTRRENVRIHNLAVDEKVPLTEQVVKFLNAVREFVPDSSTDRPQQLVILPFVTADISVCHFIKGKAGTKRQIIVRFVSRSKVYDVFQIKRKLKIMPEFKDVFITDDLTSLRLKLKDIVKKADGVSEVRTRDGNIVCSYKKKTVTIASPDDLFNINVEVDLDSLGLGSYA